jgi:YggT family protein
MLDALIFLVRTFADLYLLTFLLRFVMQWARANYYNPLSQIVFKVTNPLVVPARRLLPSVAGLDVPTLAVLVVLEIIVTFVLLRLVGLSLPIPRLLFYSLLRLISLVLWFYVGALIIYAVLSWFAQPSRNPMAAEIRWPCCSASSSSRCCVPRGACCRRSAASTFRCYS